MHVNSTWYIKGLLKYRILNLAILNGIWDERLAGVSGSLVDYVTVLYTSYMYSVYFVYVYESKAPTAKQ